MSPTRENGEDCKDEKKMAPLHLEVVSVESLHKIHGEKSKHKQVEENPRNEESSFPFSYSVTGETDKE